ncbi:MAG: TonB-dependent receptor, partial [Candidatus Zixiibacteriota bacterium]
MIRKLISIAVLFALAFGFLLPQVILAGTTGKFTGTITNEETGEPLPGVAVSLEGTTMGALTNEEGEYLIHNVPVGTYSLKASLIGFSPVEITNLSVNADLATWTDFKLSKKALDLNKTIVVRADRPLIMKDKTTSVSITTSDELEALPIRGYEQVISLQNSVVRMKTNVDIRQRGARESRAVGGELNLRGGRPQEVAYYVDGFSQQDPLSGNSTANLPNNAIKEVAVTSGAFSAEYGNVASGIVNVTTNSGTDEYHANLDMSTDNIMAKSFDQNYYSADVSGPIPGLEKSYFFFSGERRWLRDRQPSIKTEEVFTKYHLDTLFDEPQRLPSNDLSAWYGQGRLDFELTSNIKLAMNGNYSFDRWQQYYHGWVYNYNHCPITEDKNYGINANVTHTLNPKTYYNLSVSYFMTERVRGDGVIFDDLAAYYRPEIDGNPEWDDLNLFRENREAYYMSEVDSTVAEGSPGDTLVY